MAERVSVGDPSSSCRANAVIEARSSLNNKNAVNQAAGGVASNIIQNTSNVIRADFKAPITKDIMKVNSVQDNTKRIIPKLPNQK